MQIYGSPNRKQSGQIVILASVLLLIMSILLIAMYNTSLATSKKMKVVNAADASAYSAAIWTARQLNYMAYTNRAMMANHILVGHFISYMSWLRYVDDVAKNLNRVAFWIPVVGQITGALKSVSGILEKVTDIFGKIYVPSIDLLNTYLMSTQLLSKAYGIIAIPKLMEETAIRHDPEMVVNDASKVDDEWAKNQTQGYKTLNAFRYAAFTKTYTTGNDSGRMSDVIRRSFGSSQPWLQNRNWGPEGLPFLVQFRKQGSTTMRNDLKDWNASDRMQTRTWNVPKFKWNGWSTLASGEANAQEYWKFYKGVRGYQDLRGRGPFQKIAFTAVVSLPTSNLKLKDYTVLKNGPKELQSSVQNISAISRAEVFHNRPYNFGFFSAKAPIEFSNLFNPFWQARLISTHADGEL